MTDVGPLQVEATGETVGEAKWSALRELERMRPGIDKAAVSFQVLSEGARGLLGVGYEPARVLATIAADAEPAPPADDSELAAQVRDMLEHVCAALGLHCRVDIRETEDAVLASCSGRDLGLLIGKRGQTIDAVQYLVNAIAHRAFPEPRKPVIVDAAGYRDRREASLSATARRSAERALQTGRRVALEPMTAVERKVVHVALKEYPGVTTTSEGTEPNRFVVVVPGEE